MKNAGTDAASIKSETASAGSLQIRVIFMAFLVNLAGGALMYLYITVIDVSSLSKMRFVQSWETLAISVLPAFLSAFIIWRYSRPVIEYLRVVSRLDISPLKESSGGGRIIHIRRRALRFPLFCALASFIGWSIMGLVIVWRVWSGGQAEIEVVVGLGNNAVGDLLASEMFNAGSELQRYFRSTVQSVKSLGLTTLIGGMISAITFFTLENIWERELPRFFPEGKLTDVKDVWIMPVRYRLMAIFVLVGTVPLIMMAVLSYQRASFLAYQPPEEVLGGLLVFNLFMVIAGVGLAVLLSVFAAKSVSEPLERLKEGIRKVGEGETEVRVNMRANDEIGNVTEGFNRMVNSLDEKRRSIRELTEGLENKVKDRTSELEHALDEKEHTQAQLVHSEKMAGLGQLVAGVAHEINNPIGFIYANTDNLERLLNKMKAAFENGDNKTFDNTEEKMRRLIKSTGEGAKRTKEIVQGLRSFSRKDPLAKGPVDVHEIIETALMLLGHEFKHGIELKRVYGQLRPVNGNAGELSQVFMNIMINAVQAMGEVGTLTVTTDSDDKIVSVKIEDTGSGISPENIEHLFEPFFTTKDVGSGTGLGLAIVYGIVKSHGGDIKVNSSPGVGTCMEVLLPFKESS